MSTRTPVGSGTRDLEKREFLDFTENFQAYVYYYAYLTLLLCVFELTVARNNYIYVSTSRLACACLSTICHLSVSLGGVRGIMHFGDVAT